MTAVMMNKRTWLSREGYGKPYIQATCVLLVPEDLFDTDVFTLQLPKLGYSTDAERTFS